MTYVLQLSPQPPLLDVSLIKSLHFMMLKYDLTKHPGQWRPGSVWIEDDDGSVVYEAPEREVVDDLVTEALDQVNTGHEPAIVRAAMAHLNLTLIHPFSDGNGRMARCLQTHVLASDGHVISPEFSSIEEYLGRNTAAYYDVLTEVAQGRWSPSRDARPWLRFCLTAHYRQARATFELSPSPACWSRSGREGHATTSRRPSCELSVKRFASTNGVLARRIPMRYRSHNFPASPDARSGPARGDHRRGELRPMRSPNQEAS
jgi:hypothetical protein